MTSVRWEDREGERWIHVRGELDYGQCEQCAASFETACREAPGDVVVDLADVPFIASPGFEMLLRTHRHRRTQGHSLLLTGLRPPIRHVFQTVGILRAIPERSEDA